MNLKRHRQRIVSFFDKSTIFDYSVTRPLSHIYGNWELTWTNETHLFEAEDDSFALHVNKMIEDIARSPKPSNYHKPMNEHLSIRTDIMLLNREWVYTATHQKLSIEDLGHYISQESIGDEQAIYLIQAAAGRIKSARRHKVLNYDELDDKHMTMLAQILISILYGRL